SGAAGGGSVGPENRRAAGGAQAAGADVVLDDEGHARQGPGERLLGACPGAFLVGGEKGVDARVPGPHLREVLLQHLLGTGLACAHPARDRRRALLPELAHGSRYSTIGGTRKYTPSCSGASARASS